MVTAAVILVLIAALTSKAVDFLKYLRAGDSNGYLTQAVVWGAGIGASFLIAKSGLAGDVVIEQLSPKKLGDYNAWALVLLGLASGSLGSVLVDVRKAVDSSDSAKTPNLFG